MTIEMVYKTVRVNPATGERLSAVVTLPVLVQVYPVGMAVTPRNPALAFDSLAMAQRFLRGIAKSPIDDPMYEIWEAEAEIIGRPFTLLSWIFLNRGSWGVGDVNDHWDSLYIWKEPQSWRAVAYGNKVRAPKGTVACRWIRLLRRAEWE